MTPPKLSGLDADGTRWHNETLFRLTHARFNALLAPWADAAAVERRNLGTCGCGAKGFTLSMLETAPQLSDAQAPATKLAASGLGRFFAGVEIVSGKNAETCRRAFTRHGVLPEHALMVGNSVKSDVLPAPVGHARFRQCDSMTALAEWLAGAAA